MRSRWPILALLCLLASLLAGGIASAHSASGSENRVWAFDLADQVHAAGAAALTRHLHKGYEFAQYDSASDFPLAARRGGRATEGVYEFVGTSGKKYVGQSGDVPRRIAEHARSGKLPLGGTVNTTEVVGGKSGSVPTSVEKRNGVTSA